MLIVILLYALSASSLTIGRAIFNYVQPFFFLAVRMVGVGALLIAFSLLFKRDAIKIRKGDWHQFLLMAFFHVFLAFGLELVALQSIESHHASLFYNLAPFITALCSYFYFSEIMTKKKILGLIIGFCAFLPEIILSCSSTHFGISWAYLAMLVSIITTVFGWLTMRSLLTKGYSPAFINGIAMVGGGILSLATSFAIETWQPVPVLSWSKFIYLTALIAFFNDILFYNLYGRLLKKYTATFLAFAGFLLPLITAFFWYYFFKRIDQLAFLFFCASCLYRSGDFLLRRTSARI